MILNNHILLVWFVVHKYQSRLKAMGIDNEEAFSRGLVGLERAIRQNDSIKGYKFSTFAVKIIRQEMFTPTGQKNHRAYVKRQLESIKQIIYQRSGKHITDEQLAKLTEMKEIDMRNVLRPTNSLEIDFSGEVLEIDSVDYREQLPEVIAGLELDEGYFAEAVQSIINNRDILNDKERKIIKLYYGINLSRRFTLEEIGVLFGVTHQAIRRYIPKILEKLKHNFQLQELYVEA